MARVKKTRTYDASGRLARAQETRARVVEIAKEMFLSDGYGGVTIGAIAERAGVSPETIYKTFGGKPGLVRAIHQRGLEGRGPVPAERRSDATSANEGDPYAIVRRWGELIAEVSPLVSPIALLVRAGADSDADLASLQREIDESRIARMTQNAKVLARRGFLREGVTVKRAAEIMWAFTAPELYDLFVVRRGWTPAALGAFAADAFASALLAPRGPSSNVVAR